VVEDQFRRRGLRSLRRVDMPLSTSPMDGLIGPIRDALHPRRYGLKNRERTNRLLLLMLLHVNRQDDRLAYAKDVRAWLEANEGRPTRSAPRHHRPRRPALPELTTPPLSKCPTRCVGGTLLAGGEWPLRPVGDDRVAGRQHDEQGLWLAGGTLVET